MKNIIVFLIVVTNVALCLSLSPIVTLPQGIVEGYTRETVNGRNFYAFEGVPYARPPVGEYRFQEPKPVKPWTGTWQAKTVFKCLQYEHYVAIGDQNKVSGDEDCLYLNVYTPDPDPTKQLDVLIHIHGGAFMFNYGGIYRPEKILDKNIVYVNLNYRLGPLGFLSTEDDIVPGNNGLKDQIMALKWIKQHIQQFGGNPDSITISGMSAGGASVEFQYLFEESKGLFHRGISQSGCVLNPWVLVEHPLQKAQKVAAAVGCPTKDSKTLVECMKKKPARQIVSAVKLFQPWLYNPFSPFAPVVDTWASKPLLPVHPYKFLQNKKIQDVPWLISYVSSEGLYPGSDFYHDEYIEHLDKNWNEIIPYVLHYNDAVPKDQLDKVSEKIRQEYFKGQKLTKDTFGILIKLMSDRLFVYDIGKAGRLHSAAVKSPVYSYYFDHRGAHSKSESRTNSNENIGVSHADDTMYVFDMGSDTLSTSEDREITKIMTDMFLSFMENGKPNTTADWRALPKTASEPWVQLHISNPKEIFVEELKDELGNRKFWDSLPLQENEALLKTRDEL